MYRWRISKKYKKTIVAGFFRLIVTSGFQLPCFVTGNRLRLLLSIKAGPVSAAEIVGVEHIGSISTVLIFWKSFFVYFNLLQFRAVFMHELSWFAVYILQWAPETENYTIATLM